MNNDEHRRRRKKDYETEGEEIRDIFSALNESIPKLISGLIGSVYSPEAAVQMAEAIGNFYAKLKEKGIPDEVALEMTKKYVSALDFGEVMGSVPSSGSRRKRHYEEEFEEYDEDYEDEE